jgi:ketosteroid isomerase-like protein
MTAMRARCWLTAAALTLVFPLAVIAQGVEAEILKNNEKFAAAYNKGDVVAIGAMYTEDAIAFPPGGDLVKGRAAIEVMWKDVQAAGLTDLALQTLSVERDGSLAIEVGTATAKIKGAPQRIKYVVTWKRQSDGGWKLYRDIWNDMPGVTK